MTQNIIVVLGTTLNSHSTVQLDKMLIFVRNIKQETKYANDRSDIQILNSQINIFDNESNEKEEHKIYFVSLCFIKEFTIYASKTCLFIFYIFLN